ncbi:hypothetical protein [Hydrogenimonas sp.]
MSYIDLETVNQPRAYENPEENLQKEVLESIAARLEELTKEFPLDRKSEKIENVRRHDTIFIDGARGMGKTALMLNIEKFYKKNDIFFVGPVDPTLLYDSEDFLGVVLGSVVEVVEQKASSNCEFWDDQGKSEYFEALKKVSESLGAVMKLKRAEELEGGVDAIAANASSRALENHVHRFFKATSKLLGVKAMVLLIDDVDMAFKKGFDVLEVVRKFLASPYIIPIVSGEGQLYKKLLCNQFSRDISYETNRCEENESIVDDVVNQYFNKVMPNDNRSTLKRIDEITPGILLKKTKDRDEKKIIEYKTLSSLCNELVNYFVRREKMQLQVFSDDNVRSFVQLASKLKPVIEEIGKFESKKDESKKEMFYEYMLNETDQFPLFLARLEEFYRYTTNPRKFLLSVLCKNDHSALYGSEKKVLDGYLCFKGKFFQDQEYQKELKKQIFKCSEKKQSEVEIFKIKKEPKRIDLYVRKPSKREEEKAWKEAGATEKFFIWLIAHNNYYARSENRRLLIFAGKFVSLMLLALLEEKEGKKRREEVRKILSGTPYNADLENNYIGENFDKEEEEIETNLFDDREEDKILEEVKKYYEHSLGGLPPNSHALHEILHKFFNNWWVLKEEYDSRDNLRVDKLLQRMVWIFINAVGYFEKKEGVSDTNIALTEKEFSTKQLKNSEAYRYNVRWAEEELDKAKEEPETEIDPLSLTARLLRHPLISEILDENFKIENFRLGSLEDSKSVQKKIDEIRQERDKLRRKYKIGTQNAADVEYAQALLKVLEKYDESIIKNAFKGVNIERKVYQNLLAEQENKLAESFARRLGLSL